MHRSFVLMLSLVVLLGSVVVGGTVFAAQDATPTDAADHPIVGSWVVDAVPEGVSTAFSDGTIIYSAADGSSAHGVWSPTGDRTATATFLFIVEDGLRVLVRTDVEVSPDGESFTGWYTNEFFDPVTGEGSGEIGPSMVDATRINLEAPGTPVASFEEVFGAPEATPAG